jgi:phosphopantothenoylcysteine decarboxylase/phosphopantothenate--cysteine ligase
MAAAVADYRPVAPHDSKIKRGAGRLTIELEATPDILADVSRSKGERVLVGFAAETDHVAEHARQKLAAKAADLIVANDVTAAGAGFDHETNIVTLYPRDGRELPLPRMSKLEVAYRILDAALEIRRAQRNEVGSPSVASLETPVAKSASLPKAR